MPRPQPRRRSRIAAVRAHAQMVFARKNYALLGVALALVVAGYGLMVFENVTAADPVDGFLSLYVAPLLLLGGYLGIVYAILWRPRFPDEEVDADA